MNFSFIQYFQVKYDYTSNLEVMDTKVITTEPSR